MGGAVSKDLGVADTADSLIGRGLIADRLDEFLLLREEHHRVANMFTVLLGSLRSDRDLLASPEARPSLVRLENRILALGRMHRSLLIGASSGRISVQNYLAQLCKALSDALLEPIGLTCEVRADPGEFPSERCELLGLVIAELVMNSAKHAFGNRLDGAVRVELIRNTDTWSCIVSDNGIGTGDAASGVGSKIVQQLVRTMGGRIEMTSSLAGTSTVIICPFVIGKAKLTK